MTIVVDTDELGARRIEAHLYKLVNVLRVENITVLPAVFRDLAMIKVAATAESRTHIMQLVDVFRARVVDVAPDSLIIEITGTEDKIDGLLEVLRPYGVMEMVRTGPCRHVARPRRTRRTASRKPSALPRTITTYFTLFSYVSPQSSLRRRVLNFPKAGLCVSASLR